MAMEASEKPVFLPPRKRGFKSSKSSTECLQKRSSSNYLAPNLLKVDSRANRKLNLQSSESLTEYSDVKNSAFPNYHSPAKYFSTYQHSARSDESDMSCDVFDHDHMNDSDAEQINEKSVLNSCFAKDNFVTMIGTVKRGKKKGQTMDMKVQMSREELNQLEHSIVHEKLEDDDRCFFGYKKGPHVLSLSLVCVPFVLCLSSAYSFYMGTMTWYNILVYFSERKSIFHKMFLCPLLIISFPFLIIFLTIGLGIYASVVQISWYFDTWKREIQDWEKGFYGWFCGVLDVEDCSPYEVVILTEVLPPSEEVIQQKLQIADTIL